MPRTATRKKKTAAKKPLSRFDVRNRTVTFAKLPRRYCTICRQMQAGEDVEAYWLPKRAIVVLVCKAHPEKERKQIRI